MSRKLLIDARQSDETRVVLINNTKIEDFDYETSHRKPLRGNIYLARVTRVEPSLQAAFVEYGGNRQGFLAFSEIHPDYYRIPVEDREKLLTEEAEEAAKRASAAAENPDDDEDDTSGDENADKDSDDDNDDSDEDIRPRNRQSNFTRRYKIQEVISRHQIILVQVAKEERGNKGAALTTYISLAGRYCVLMPNTHHGGGVSRKISDVTDRKKIKSVVSSLDLPQGMGVIVRTAGAKRTKAEITRDFNYLTRQWNNIRDKTMKSNAPSLIHEEGNLINRAIRDYYSVDVDEIIVEGDEAYKAAKHYMKDLMPNHVKKISAYENTDLPMFQHYQIEEMLTSMQQPQVTLKSGGYLVINQTEALVAIDINSGRATKERNIEETALKTNLEAAEEIARQLRLRDLSGLIVLDFIDMEVRRNQNAVERKLKEAIKSDRARIQTSGISQFGLLEMSRQRLRPSLSETLSNTCPHCKGSGIVYSTATAALFALRSIETTAPKVKSENLNVHMHSSIAMYILNNKRSIVDKIEERLKISIAIHSDDSLVAPELRFDEMPEQGNTRDEKPARRRPERKSTDTASADTATSTEGETQQQRGDSDDEKPRRRHRRGKGGRRHGSDNLNTPATATDNGQDATESQAASETTVKPKADIDASDKEKKETKKTSTKAKAKKATAKKTPAEETSAEETPAEKTSAAKSTSTAKTKKAAKTTKDKEPRQALSSAPLDVVDVGSAKPKAPKKGWWSS